MGASLRAGAAGSSRLGTRFATKRGRAGAALLGAHKMTGAAGALRCANAKVATGISCTPTGGVVLAATIRAAHTRAHAAIQPEREKRGVVLRSGCSRASTRALSGHLVLVVAPGANCGAGARRVNSCRCVRQAAYGRASPVVETTQSSQATSRSIFRRRPIQ